MKLYRILIVNFFISFFGTAIAADNSIYIDQLGSNATVTVTQDGAGNVVRGIQGVGSSNVTPSKIYGDGNQVSVSQVGSGNTLSLGLTTTVAASPPIGGNTFTYNVTGNNATAILNSNSNGLGTSASNIFSITQTGNTANANINILGSKNSITAVTSGGASNSVISTINGTSNTETISMTGGGANVSTISQTGTLGSVSLTSIGASNQYTVTQSGGFVLGHSTVIDVNGSSNTMGIIQSGTSADSVVNLKSVGSGNTFTINSNTN